MSYSPLSATPEKTRKASSIGRFVGLLVLLASGAVWAQRVPDAGSLLREQLKTAPKLPEHSVPAIRRDDSAAPVAPAPGSVQFVLTSIRISGNSAFTEPELLALVQD